jgi:hypothetical protein
MDKGAEGCHSGRAIKCLDGRQGKRLLIQHYLSVSLALVIISNDIIFVVPDYVHLLF